MKPREARGSTFTEVLVCIPCVILLLILLLPAVHSAKEKARQAQCISNMRGIALAVMMFAAEHDRRLPAAGKCGRNLENDWTWGGNVIPLPQTDPKRCERVRVEEGALWPYIMGMDRVGRHGKGKALPDGWYSSPKTNPYLCPVAGDVGRKRGLSYSMNCRLEVPQDGGAVLGAKLTGVKRPSTTVLLVDESELTLNDGYFDPGGNENKSPELHAKHREGGNIAFCDGHVSWIETKQFLKVMDPKSGWFVPRQ